MIFQDPLTSLNPLQTIGQQLVETIDLHLGTGEAAARRRAVDLLRQVGIPEPELRVMQHPTSSRGHAPAGGDRPRPRGGARRDHRRRADDRPRRLDPGPDPRSHAALCKGGNVGMMIITHDMGVIADVTDRVSVMYRGRLVEHGTTEQVLGRPEHPYTRSLISAVPRPDVKLVRFPLVTYIEDAGEMPGNIDVERHWLGQARDFEGAGGAAAPGSPLIALESLHMRFTTRRSFLRKNRVYLDAVRDVSLDIHEGEVFGLVGESGSGKSTVARMICGLHAPVAGAIRFAGTELTALRREADLDPFRRQMQMIFQDPYSSLNPRMRVRDIVAEPIRFHRLADGREEVEGIVAGPPRAGRARGGGGGPLSARVLGRSTPAHLDRPGPRNPAPVPHLRRADLRPRRLHPGPGAEPPEGPAGAPRPHDALHQPRSAGHPPDVRPGRGHAGGAPVRGARDRRASSRTRGTTTPGTSSI